MGFRIVDILYQEFKNRAKKIIYVVRVLQKHKNQTHQTLNQEIQENRKGFLFLERNEER